MIYLYTDGSVSRPGDGTSPGGWAFTFQANGKTFRGSGGCRSITSNQAEMIAVIKGLQELLKMELEEIPVCVVSDSQYVIHGCSLWMIDWKRKGWLDGRNRRLKNIQYWKQIDYLASHFNIRFKWIRGHRGNPSNESCDQMARAAAFRAEGLANASIMT